MERVLRWAVGWVWQRHENTRNKQWIGGISAIEAEGKMVGEKAGRRWAEQRIRYVIASVAWPAQMAVAGEDGRVIEYTIRWRTIQLNSGLGPLCVHRPVYIATGQPTLQPADAWLGIDRSRSPMLLKMCAAMAAQVPFAETHNLLTELTPIEISASTFRDVALDLGHTAQ